MEEVFTLEELKIISDTLYKNIEKHNIDLENASEQMAFIVMGLFKMVGEDDFSVEDIFATGCQMLTDDCGNGSWLNPNFKYSYDDMRNSFLAKNLISMVM